MNTDNRTREDYVKLAKGWADFALSCPEYFMNGVDEWIKKSAEFDKVKRQNKLFRKCLHRAQRLYNERHPEADGIMDGAERIAWVLEQIKVLEDQKKNSESGVSSADPKETESLVDWGKESKAMSHDEFGLSRQNLDMVDMGWI